MIFEITEEEWRKYHVEFIEAKPFPHIELSLMSGALPTMFPGIGAVAKDMLLDWPDMESAATSRFDNEFEKKFAMNDINKMGPFGHAMVAMFNSPSMLTFFEFVTGIKGLIPDDDMVGGGFHEIPRGGKLEMHIDFAKHAQHGWYRRLNALIYLNDSWSKGWGGNLILRNEAGDEKVIAPEFPKVVLFATTGQSWHGHPEPLNPPPGRTRKSMAFYYYTEEPGGSISNDDTVFRRF